MTDNGNLAPQTPEQEPALVLAEALRAEQLNPDPTAYRAAGELLYGYFAGKVNEVPAGRDSGLEDALDNTVTAVGGLFARDEATVGATKTGKIGDHYADGYLENALRAAWSAQVAVEQTGKSVPQGGSAATGRMLEELTFFKDADISTEVGAGNSRPLRHRAADALRTATRSVDTDPVAYGHLAEAGAHAAHIIDAMAETTARHQADTGLVGRWDSETNQLVNEQGNIPLYKDYLARHVSAAVEATQA